MSSSKVVLVVWALLGVLVTTQFKVAKPTRQAASRQVQETLAQEVSQVFANNQKLVKQLAALVEENQKLEQSNLSVKARSETLGKSTTELKTLVGQVPVRGEGVEVAFDKGLTVTQAIDLLNALWNIGAEAIELNGKRILWMTGIDEPLLSKSITIRVIGKRELLREGLERRGGILEQIGGKPRLTVTDELRIGRQ